MSLQRWGRSGINLLWSSGSEILIRLMGLGYVVVLARYLEPADFGTFSTLLAYFFLALALGNLGLDRLALRELAHAAGWHGSAFPTLLGLRLAAAVLTGGLLFSVGTAARDDSALFFAIVALGMIPSAVGSSFVAAFQARERFSVPAAAGTATAVTMASLSIIGVVLHAPLAYFLSVLVVAESVRAVWLLWAAKREGWRLEVSFDRAFARYALLAAAPYGVLAILGTIYFRMDLVMLDWMNGSEEAGLYAGAYRILDALLIIPGLVLGVLFPRFARLTKADPGEARALYLSVSRTLVWLGIPIAATGILFADPLLRLLYAGHYAGAVPALIWLMIALIFLFWHAPNVTVLFAGDRLGRVVVLSFITVGFNLAWNLVLIPRYGAAGAAWATAASEVLSLLVFTPIVCRRLGISASSYFQALRSPWIGRENIRLLTGAAGAPAITDAANG